jgi:hypothetical protein
MGHNAESNSSKHFEVTLFHSALLAVIPSASWVNVEEAR